MAQKSGKRSKNVKIVADGTRQVVLMFPEGISLKVKKSVSYDELAKLLGADETDEVQGQCHLAAIGGVRG